MPKTPVKRQSAKAKPAPKQERYWEAVGRRKTAIARVRVADSKHPTFIVNAKPFEEYFQDVEHRVVAKEALENGAAGKTFAVSALVHGGGMSAQAEAIRHALARALVGRDETHRERMKTLRYLTRDPRMRERKKFGLRRARRATQWRKR
jgi:small subunit ribosomal protein S9